MPLRLFIAGFVAGALAVLVFHQAGIAALHALGVVPRAPYSMAPTAPWAVPQVVSSAFWGGLWGIVLVAFLRRQRGARLLFAALVFGMLLPSLVGWFIVAPLRGQPIAAGGVPSRMAIGLFVNGLWGLGTGLLLLVGQRSLRRND